MSKYDWERGSLKLPKAEITKLRTALIEAHNRWQLELLAEAKAVHAKLVNAKKGKRDFDLAEELNALYGRRHPAGGFDMSERNAQRALDVGRLIFKYGTREVGGQTYTTGEVVGLKAPRKKDLDLKPKRPVKVTFQLFDGVTICIDTNERTLSYDVPENNRAVETARRLPLVRTMFRELSTVKWTRGTGGVFVGNDEYNREDYDDGGGANYVTSSYGPLGNPLSRV